MSESLAPQPLSITELSGVVSAKFGAGPGEASTLYYTQVLPEGASDDEAEQHELIVARDDLAVVRFAGAAGTEEHVEFFGGRTSDPRSELDEISFAHPGREGELRVLDFERAHTIARYIGSEVDRLRRLHDRAPVVARRIPTQRRGSHSGGHVSAVPSGTRLMMAERQRQVIDQLVGLATHDFVHGIFDPATARTRAMVHLAESS